jgi:GT2 family glycosyltransferase
MRLPKVSIIIVNWNGKKYLEHCLNSVYNQAYPNYEVIFVDNGSSDGSVEYVEANFPQAKIKRLDQNYGFAEANNVGIEEAFKDSAVKYIATLNNDTEVDSFWLGELVKVIEMHEDVGSVAPKILLYHDHKLLDCVGICIYRDCNAKNRGRLEEDNKQYDSLEEVFGPTAAAALYRREMIQKIGLFDEDYFAYYEDVDLAWKARLAGWKCLYVPQSLVYHIHSATSKSFSTFKAYYTERNRIWNMIKFFPIYMIFLSIWYTIMRYLLLTCGVGLGRGAAKNFLERQSAWTMATTVVRAYLGAFKVLPKIIKKRKQVQATRRVSNSEINSWFHKFGVGPKKLILG